jgi:alkylation response protein AidB-like acyl-CoA dehydrogenase
VLRRHSDLGYTAVSIFPPVDTKYLGGLKLPAGIEPANWDGFHDLIVIDEIARCGFLGVIWALGCGNSIGTPPLINFGTTAQKQKYLPGVMRGQTRFCLGVTEPDGSSFPARGPPISFTSLTPHFI